jgi:hypothetical protein
MVDMETTTLTWKRLGAGTYEARTGDGYRDRFYIEHVEAPASETGGYGRLDHWAVTYPGSNGADSLFETLRDAKRGCLASLDTA